MRYQVVFTQDGWGVKDTLTGRMTDSMVATLGEARQLAEQLERHDQRVEVRISQWESAAS